MKVIYPLLKFKERLDIPTDIASQGATFDFSSGYWIDGEGRPLVLQLIAHSNDAPFGQTTKTATREGADQSESVFGQTLATRSREGIDQSESATPIYGQSRITETREGIDRSENSSW